MDPEATFVPPYMLRVRAAISSDASFADLACALADEWLPSQGLEPSQWCRDPDRTKSDGTIDPEYAPGPPPREVLTDPARRDLDYFVGSSDWSVFLLTYDEQRPGDRSRNTFGHRHCQFVRTTIFLKEADAARTSVALRASLELGDFLATRFRLLGLVTDRGGNGFAPSAPHATLSVHQMLVSRAAIAESYVQPDVYWTAWPEQRALDDDRVLVTRGRGVIDELAFKQATYPAQWALARAAMPKRTGYGALYNGVSGFRVLPYEEAYFQSGEGVLSATHYDEATGTVDVTAWAEPGTHIAPREVAMLVRWAFGRSLDDGRPIQDLRVTFATREQALSQKRVLIDAGCRVFHYGATPTDLVELTD